MNVFSTEQEDIACFQHLKTNQLADRISDLGRPNYKAITAYLNRRDASPIKLAELAIFNRHLSQRMRENLLTASLMRCSNSGSPAKLVRAFAELAYHRHAPDWARKKIKDRYENNSVFVSAKIWAMVNN